MLKSEWHKIPQFRSMILTSSLHSKFYYYFTNRKFYYVILTDLLNKMTSPIDNVSLLHVLECVANQWKLLVGSSPISRFVAQLCKLTLGWTMTSTLRPLTILDDKNEANEQETEISHIEFSRLNDSTSSSGEPNFFVAYLQNFFASKIIREIKV